LSKVPAGKDIGEFVELKFKAGWSQQHGIPQEGCRVRQSALEQMLKDGGNFDVNDAIVGLMDWLDVTDEPAPALHTLQKLLNRHYPADGRPSGRCRFADEQGVDRIFHVGEIDIQQPLVAWQRRDWIIALSQPSAEPGRMVVGAPQPITLKTALRILSQSMLSYMGEPFDSFIGAHTSGGSTAVFYLWDAGEVTPIRWDDGLDAEKRASVADWAPTWLPGNQLAAQVAIAAGYLK
jgi:hypothetical protein